MNPAELAVLRRRAARRRRLRAARRYAVPVSGPQVDRWRAAVFGDQTCQPFRITIDPGGRVLVVDVAPVHAARPVEHICPTCGVERTDYEGPGAHLPTCPNCGSDADPITVDEAERVRAGRLADIADELARRAAAEDQT